MQSETSLQGSLSVERMCQLGQVSRAGFYRYFQTRAPIEESMTVRSAIQEIALEHRRRYGYRRITAELPSMRYARESQTGRTNDAER